MGDYVRDLGEDPPATLESISRQAAEIIRLQKEEESRRKWTLAFTIGGALFAAIRLGWIFVPRVRARAGQLGGTAPISNPRRR
jgi:hypothetical protein